MNLISVSDAATKLGVDTRSIRWMIENGRIKQAVKIGGRWLIPNKEVNWRRIDKERISNSGRKRKGVKPE